MIKCTPPAHVKVFGAKFKLFQCCNQVLGKTKSEDDNENFKKYTLAIFGSHGQTKVCVSLQCVGAGA